MKNLNKYDMQRLFDISYSNLKKDIPHGSFNFSTADLHANVEYVNFDKFRVSFLESTLLQSQQFDLHNISLPNSISFCFSGFSAIRMDGKDYLKGDEVNVLSVVSQQNIQDAHIEMDANLTFKVVAIEFTQEEFKRLMSMNHNNFLLYESINSMDIMRILSSIRHNEYDRDLRRIFLEAKVLELSVVLQNYFNKKGSTGLLRRFDKLAAREAKEFIDAHFYYNLSLEGIAKATHSNTSSLKKDFKDAYGLTVFEYIKDKRLSLAKELLESGDFNVTQACYFVGYNSLPSFSRSFKEKYNYSPIASRLS